MKPLQSQVINIIEDLKLNRSAVTLDTSLHDDLLVDSLSLTELIIACEEQFDIEIDMDDPEILKIDTVNDLCLSIEKLL
jgi:acyl carrier protein